MTDFNFLDKYKKELEKLGFIYCNWCGIDGKLATFTYLLQNTQPMKNLKVLVYDFDKATFITKEKQGKLPKVKMFCVSKEEAEMPYPFNIIQPQQDCKTFIVENDNYDAAFTELKEFLKEEGVIG